MSAVLIISSVFAFSQGGICISTPASTPDASALLDLKSTNKGFLVPRMTSQARSIIPFPATGLMVYQIDGTTGFYYFNGVGWVYMAPTAASDNLGNHQMTQSLRTNNFLLSRYGTDKGIRILDSGAVSIITNNLEYYPGSGATAERFKFDVAGGFVAKGILGIGAIPATGAGERMMWHPNKAAFRAGSIGSSGIQWDESSIGYYTTAFGYNTTSLGLSALASGYQSGAFGAYSNALGYTCTADGTGAVAIGYRCTADADYSTAFGQRASTNGHAGAMVFSDASTVDSTEASLNNQLTARFANGYRFYTNATTTVGVSIGAGGNSWAAISDSSKKENYQQASGDYFLEKLAGLKLGSWNYKGQDPMAYRHYGPMAQEIYSAYGKDHFGVIGCDTTLASADMDGIMMIMLQGLEKRTSEQKETIAALQKENALLRLQLAEVADLKAQVKKLIVEMKTSTAAK